jgi:oxalate decarboxylase
VLGELKTRVPAAGRSLHNVFRWGIKPSLTMRRKRRFRECWTGIELCAAIFVPAPMFLHGQSRPPDKVCANHSSGPDGCEFLLVFDEGTFSEDDTTLISDWTIHTPREVLAKNWNVSRNELQPLNGIPSSCRYIFQAPVPGPLQQDVQAVTQNGRPATNAFNFSMMKMKPTKSTKSGEIRIVGSSTLHASADIAAAHVTVKPGGMREMHWHPNADEWQYYIQGKGRMTVFFNAATARTQDFTAGDVGYIPQTLGHYIENTGDTDLVFLEMFKAPHYRDISFNDWITHLPPELVTAHLDISNETLAAIPTGNFGVLPV